MNYLKISVFYFFQLLLERLLLREISKHLQQWINGNYSLIFLKNTQRKIE